jgi:hypothetical protein
MQGLVLVRQVLYQLSRASIWHTSNIRQEQLGMVMYACNPSTQEPEKKRRREKKTEGHLCAMCNAWVTSWVGQWETRLTQRSLLLLLEMNLADSLLNINHPSPLTLSDTGGDKYS